MSQSQAAPSTGRVALALGIVALIIGATALGFAVYIGYSQLPSQLSSLTANKTCAAPNDCNKTIIIDWFLSNQTGQDRFYPNQITVLQGDNVTIMLVTNDTTDAHTFTMGLGLRGYPGSIFFQMNNSWTGLSSGDLVPFPNDNITGRPDGCQDSNGQSITCNTFKADDTSIGGTGPSGACNNTANGGNGIPCDLWSIGYLGVVNTPGVFEFHCFYHHAAGMVGYITVLPNKGFSPY
ncbi:hypothetical protein J2P12_03270 [Candidatus Bathyarchaeota archaeon]|nr:hypothetical protein [Candidatus Bathyarchaeota archaeon]